MIPIDDVVHFDAVTSDPTTAAVSDADSTPTFDVFEEATDTAILSAQNFTKRTSKTGNYRGAFTASAANGFEAGKWYNVIASATVNGVAGKCVVLTFRCAPAENVAGYPLVDVTYADGATPPSVDDVADGVLLRDWTQILASVPARCLLNAARFLRNKWTLSTSALSVKEEDDTTEAWAATVSTDPAAEPIVGSDPS
jgi:hypothetical protein